MLLSIYCLNVLILFLLYMYIVFLLLIFAYREMDEGCVKVTEIFEIARLPLFTNAKEQFIIKVAV